MLRVSPRIFVATCVSVLTFAGTAAAQRAPITYSGADGASPATVTEAVGLAGGGERSYGYGAQHRPSARQPAVIDLRRPSGVRVQRVADFQPVAATEDDDDDAPEAQSPSTPTPAPQAAPTEQGAQPWLERERVGPPYQANGQWYVPTPEPGYEQIGTASWYGPTFNGGRTASGEAFDQTALTAAHPTLPIPSLVQVTNLENGREVIVRVNDRGPFVGGRVMDVSQGAAQVLGFEQAGHARVHLRYLGPAPRHVNADGSDAPATQSVPAAVPRSEVEEGPASLLPPSSATPTLAGGPAEQSATPAPASAQYTAAADGAFFVQVGAYSDLGNAQRVRDAVGAAGPVAVDTRHTSSGAELFRVRVGPWASREEADAARRTVASLGYSDAVVAAR